MNIESDVLEMNVYKNLRFTQERRLRIIHALKLYYNRVHFYLQQTEDGKTKQKDYLTKEAVETLLMINELENKI